MPKHNIAIITGTRAEFGIWTPILYALQTSKKLRPQLIATGMHLQRHFGYTLSDIKRAGIPVVATVPMYKKSDAPADSLARATANLAKTFKKLKPDLVMFLGDRLEMLAGASAALASHLPIAHLHGGETAPGTWDEQIRHAVTKLAHLHFPATHRAAQRIAQMGEDPQSIHVIGAPALDTLLAYIKVVRREFSGVRHVPQNANHAMVLLHPSSPDETQEKAKALQMLFALRASQLPFSVVGPNNDPGHKGILAAYAETETPVDMSMSQVDFWYHLHSSSLLIGNSSSGIIEAASLGIPVINLGDRQKGRERNPNVLDLPWSAGKKGIIDAIRFALTNKPFRKKIAARKNLYGDGHAAQRLLKILESLAFPIPTTKQFHDLTPSKTRPFGSI